MTASTLALWVLAGLAGPAEAPTATVGVPWFLPRTASVGLAYNEPVLAPQLRVSWELGFVEQRSDHLVATLTLGSGFARALPRGMRTLEQHVLLGGLALRSTRGRLHFGIGASAGVSAHRATFDPATRLSSESRVTGYSDASARLGVTLRRGFVLGAQLGYGAPWYVDPSLLGAVYTGGATIGVFADWR